MTEFNNSNINHCYTIGYIVDPSADSICDITKSVVSESS